MFWSCDQSTGPGDTEEASDIKKFVWNGMNTWYFWQDEVSDLSDDRFSGDTDFNEFLNNFSDGRDLFNTLLFRQEDDFSFFIDDFKAFEERRRGQTDSFGFSYGLVRPDGNSSQLFGYVQYVYDSPAKDGGLGRGDIFTEVNGNRLTTDNFRDLLGQSNIELTLAEIESTSPFSISDSGETVDLSARNIIENPILHSDIIEKNGSRIGYLVYNAFRFNFHEELNEVFGEFTAGDVDELILDLRYNGGGALVSSALLGTLISDLDEAETFASLIHNEKQSDNNREFTFLQEYPVWDRDGNSVDTFDDPNTLNLNRIHVLTSRNTTSASEALINALLPFTEVIVIGSQTVGKDEGSITVYDSPPDYNSREDANSDHMRALQPIVNKILNSEGNDYPNGFFPEREVREIDYLDDLPALGSEEEPLLSTALEFITGEDLASLRQEAALELEDGILFSERLELIPFGQEMYLLPDEKYGDTSVPVN